MQLLREIRNANYIVARFPSVVKTLERRQKLYRAICVLRAVIPVKQSTRVHDDLVSSWRVVRVGISAKKQHLGSISLHFVDQKIDHLAREETSTFSKKKKKKINSIASCVSPTLAFRSKFSQAATFSLVVLYNLAWSRSCGSMLTDKRNSRPIWDEAAPNRLPPLENLTRSRASRWRWTQRVILGRSGEVGNNLTNRQFPVMLQLARIGNNGWEARSATAKRFGEFDDTELWNAHIMYKMTQDDC